MQFLSQDKLVKTQNGQHKRKHYLNFSLTVDLFEVRVNKKKDKYYAFFVEPDSLGTDAFPSLEKNGK